MHVLVPCEVILLRRPLGFSVYPGILSRRKKVSPYIAGKCHRKTKSNSCHDFKQCSLHHQTTVKALGSLESGFSHPMGLNYLILKFWLDLLWFGCRVRGFFCKVTLLSSWTIFPGNFGLLLLFTSRLIISFKQQLAHTWKVGPKNCS